jgi:hypothetical protein
VGSGKAGSIGYLAGRSAADISKRDFPAARLIESNFDYPVAITVNSAGAVFVADDIQNRVRKVQ